MTAIKEFPTETITVPNYIWNITHVEFDFTVDDEDGELTEEQQEEVYQSVVNNEWVAPDMDSLVDLITDTTGWCINDINAEAVEKAELKFTYEAVKCY